MIGGMDRTAGGFEAFYRAAWRDAVRWATALTGSHAAGEDVAQSAFAAIAPRFETVDDPTAYLRRSIVNLARSAHRSGERRHRRERSVGDDRTLTLVTTEPYDGGSDLLRRLAPLPHDQRAALVLRYWADWDEAAIADALGCKPATVRSHVKRALDTLRADHPEALR